MICPTCGYQNAPHDKFCQQCGLTLPKAERSKLPLVIIISFLIFTALGTGAAYYLGIINNDPKYVSYQNLEFGNITGKWKLAAETNKGTAVEKIEIKDNKVTFSDDGKTSTLTLAYRYATPLTKTVVFMDDSGDNWFTCRLEKRKINGIERVVLAVPIENNVWSYYVREGK